MDEFTADAFVNRDEPLPLISVPTDDAETGEERTRKRDKVRRTLSPSRLKAKSHGFLASQLEEHEPATASKPSLQDRLFSKILQQVIPAEDVDDDEEGESAIPVDHRSSKYVARPAFSLPLMTNNFRRFNARIGIVFVFQNRVIRLFTWRTPTHTLSFLAAYTFVCLDPYLLVVLPVAVALLFIMIPAFTSRHPPPPQQSTSSTTPYSYQQAYTGPALAPARTIKPASETSKDFFRNMRDLQNSMADFSNLHDALVQSIAPVTNFSNEAFSSQVFLYLTILTTASLITAHLLPWRLIALVLGWTVTVSSHPTAQSYLQRLQKRAEAQTQQALNDPALRHARYIHGIPLPATPAAIHSSLTAFSEVTLSTTPETREVEIFELQHRPLRSVASDKAAEWQPHLFTPSPYDPLSPSRIAGDRPRGTRFFEDVSPPDGWEWASKKWELDLEAGEWVNDRLVVGVEYDVLHHGADGASAAVSTARRESVNADFGGWVWDLPPVPGSGASREDDLWLAYGDYNVPSLNREDEGNKRKKQRSERDQKSKKLTKDWEEATVFDNTGRTGEWRRRRWVRLVKRQTIETVS
ncbi:Peroxisome size and maintenance regulator [Exophiala oligosperma]